MWEPEREMAPRCAEGKGGGEGGEHSYPIAFARPRRLVSVRGAVEAVGRVAIRPIPRPVEANVVL
jgi:hypothetical protein